jgi:hypothetical protein
MPIALSCQTCGRELRVKDELAGQEIYCPDCKSILTVPAGSGPVAEYSVPEAMPAHTDTESDFAARSEQPASAPVQDAQPANLEDWVRRTGGRPGPSRPKPQFGTTSAGIRGGIVMMIIAVIWSVVGLVLLNHFFIYPIILFIVGLIAFVKALFGEQN